MRYKLILRQRGGGCAASTAQRVADEGTSLPGRPPAGQEQVAEVDTGPGDQADRKAAQAGGKYFDPEALLESIANESIALTRGRWVVAHFEAGGKLMRRQDLPPEAFFTVDELRKLVAALGDNWGLLFVAISYRWLTATHPDPDAFHLRIIA